MSACYASPLFAPLRCWLNQLPDRPDAAAVDALARRFPVRLDSGTEVRFVPPQADGLAYECRVWESGEVETRPDNWHDFFNALVWLSFPHTKRAVTAAHVAAMRPAGEARGSVRDALTHFDECGIVVLSRRPDLLDLLRAFEWKRLFVEHRDEVIAHMRFVVFGHATYEALLSPFRGLTAKAVLYDADDAWFALPEEAQLAAVDARLAADLASGLYVRPRDFQPLPLLGIPGVTPDSESPAYYDDAWQFRPGRRRSG
ncbi:DUF3025 domain-containing protein [Azonexus sp.]|uniref:DUF3025 domain-containing protein n=1 Tax=Azonexus sp. TaxID=1872668 RepID=UPI0035B33D48